MPGLLRRVLIVEDEQSLREPLVYLLKKEGFDTVEAADGTQAMELFDVHGELL